MERLDDLMTYGRFRINTRTRAGSLTLFEDNSLKIIPLFSIMPHRGPQAYTSDTGSYTGGKTADIYTTEFRKAISTVWPLVRS